MQNNCDSGTSFSVQGTIQVIKEALHQKKPIFLIGEAGTGKSWMIKTCLGTGVYQCIEKEISLDDLETQEGVLWIKKISHFSVDFQRQLLQRFYLQPFVFSDSLSIEQAQNKLDGSFLNGCAFISIPALRERKKDILDFVGYFLEQSNQILGTHMDLFSNEILEVFCAYDWPGNIRELENLIERFVILNGLKNEVCFEDLPHCMIHSYLNAKLPETDLVSESCFPKMILPRSGVDLKTMLTAFENHIVDQALLQTNGNKNQASILLQMNRTTLVEKLKKRGMIQMVDRASEHGLDSEFMESFS